LGIRRTLVLLALAVVCATPPQTVLADAPAAVRLAPGYRVAVTVFGQPDLSGNFEVDGEGNIELPLIGTVAVGQLSVKEAEKHIAAQLANGFLRNPAVSVRIAELRPIYVLGDVKAPGSFPFRYGSSVLSAIAQAGGYGAAEAAGGGAVADFLAADERVRTLEGSRRVLLVRKARLEAQRDGQTTFQFAGKESGEADKETSAAVAGEQEALQEQAKALSDELDLLRQQKPRLENAATAVEKQIEAEKRQFDLVQSQLNDQAKLQTMGLARRATEITLQREQAVLDSNMSRYRSELARLAVTVGDIDIKILDVQNAYKRRVLGELQEVRTKLQDIDTALPSAREVREVRLQQVGYTAAFAPTTPTHQIAVTRIVNGAVKVLAVDGAALLEPGDVVEVKRVRTQERLKSLGQAPAADGAAQKSSVSMLARP